MKRSRQITSLSVISLEEGQQIGTVKGLVVDPASKKLAALIIEQKGWFKEQRFIPYHKVHSVGNDAITVEKNSCVEKSGSLSDIVKLLKDKVGIIGSKMVAENGTVLGFVDEYCVDLATGAIAGLEFSGNLIDSVINGRAFLDIFFVRTLGKEVTIITSEGVENIFKMDGGLQETVKSLKESTGHILNSTIQKTKELGASINNKVWKDKKTGIIPDPENINEAETEEKTREHKNTAREEASGKTDAPPASNNEGYKDAPPPA
ncbi:MAG: PRC-barrel domain protein [Pelotomaculum sp. PtaU1.Bin035]|nr:MAG: PRC-barrel domain protein [Pelotomaculum sp. PtaU1.Bin035]